MEEIAERNRANETPRDGDERYRTIADSCPSMMWASDANGDIQFINRTCREFFGIDSEKVDRGRWEMLIHPEDGLMFASAFDRAIREHKPFRIETRVWRADGEWRLVGWRAEPRYSSNSEYLGHTGLCADITERVQAEQNRQFELSLVQSIYGETLEGILVVNDSGIIVSHNKRLLEIWKFSDSPAPGQPPHSIIGSPEQSFLSIAIDRAESPESFIRLAVELYDNPNVEDHCEIKLKDGRTLERHSKGLKNPEGKYLGRVWFFRDITAHKQVEVSLKNASDLADEANRRLLAERSILENERNMLRALIDNMPDFIFVKDVEGRFVVANSHLARVVGAKAPDALLGKTDFDFFPQDVAEVFREGDGEVLLTEQPLYNREEKGLVDEAGNETRLLTTRVPIRDYQGQVIGIAGIGRDISARKKLDDERILLRALIDNIPDFIYVKDAKCRFVLANLHVARLMGAETPEELLGKTDFDFYPREMAQAFFDDEQHMMRTAQPFYNREETNVDKAGNEFHVLSTKVPARDSKGQIIGIAGIGRDITARKKIENELREAERNYRGIFDNAIVGIYQSTPEGAWISVNQAMAVIFGYDSPEEMVSSASVISKQVYVDPGRRAEFERLMEEFGAVQNFEFEAYRKDGSKIWLDTVASAIREDGAAVRYEGMCDDITESKRLQEQLLQAQKLESVGQLAAGIAHEINTPTQYIGDNVRFLKDAFQSLNGLLTDYDRLLLEAKGNALSPGTIQGVEAAAERADVGYLMEEIPKAIDQSLEGITRVATLVSAMKEFSHPGTKEKVPVDLNHAIDSTITVSRNEWKYVADLDTDFDPTLPPIPCHPGEFNQVILNLIVNAAHAIAGAAQKGGPEKGKIKVQTRNCPQWAEIQIQDTGTGIPEKVRARIFDPFFTTKEIGKGTGQGLAIARSVVVDKHGGSIHFETEEGKGTTFIIRLPHDGKGLATQAVAA